MCFGGPNHCRVGRAGGQSFLAVSFTLSCDHHLCLWLCVMRLGHLLMFILVASCTLCLWLCIVVVTHCVPLVFL
jgi:hypothetical protein